VTPCSLIHAYGRFEETSCLHHHGRISSETSSKYFVCCSMAWLSSSSTRKIEAIYCSEILIKFYQVIRRLCICRLLVNSTCLSYLISLNLIVLMIIMYVLGFLVALFFHHQCGGDTFLLNSGLSRDYMALQLRKPYYS
jgi:hypothetical protein